MISHLYYQYFDWTRGGTDIFEKNCKRINIDIHEVFKTWIDKRN